MSSQDDRKRAKLEGIRRAWMGIPDPLRKAAADFYIEYARTHAEFEGGDVLAAWRATGDPIAQLDWRNRWGALSNKMKGKDFGVIKRGRWITPKNVQSHGDRAMLWKSLIYEGESE